jgi:LmbE family N-acetylglucosaminyl deacetylase
MMSFIRPILVVPLLTYLLAASQPNTTSSSAIDVKQVLDRLSNTGSVLMIAAHPDDENTALISYLARGRKVRTAYLSLTRGEGGQNVIGPEQGPELGILRTQELLDSRRVDGAEQFFSRAIDFGFSKSPAEAMNKWGHHAVLGDIVWVIRRFRPDVVILQFTGTSRDGHGQHQASAILGREAYSAAADPQKYPEQLKYVRVWQARRLMVNRRGFTPEMRKEIDALPHKLNIELGEYDPLLGYSYGELAGISRSFNASQSDGTPRARGEDKATLVTLEGTPAEKDLFEGIDTSWSRFRGGEPVGKLLQQAAQNWNALQPFRVIPLLAEAKELVARIDDPGAQERVSDIDETIAKCAGLWLDFTASQQDVISNKPVTLRVTAIQRTPVPVKVLSLKVGDSELKLQQDHSTLTENKPFSIEENRTINAGPAYTQPYWLLEAPQHNRYVVHDPILAGLPENPPPMQLVAKLQIGPSTVTLKRPVVYRYMDRLHGESITPVAYIPPVSLRFLQPTVIFPAPAGKPVELEVTSHIEGARGQVVLHAPEGWRVSPPTQQISMSNANQQQRFVFTISPGQSASSGELAASAEVNGEHIDVGLKKIDYPHIALQTLFPKAETLVVRTDAVTLSKRVGYVMGSGDEVPDALRQLGCEVVMLGETDLAEGNLAQYDAIVTGVRAYTERPELAANEPRLLEYVRNGGTLIVQYNRIERDSDEVLKHLGPYPFEIGHDRVTVEETPVEFDSHNPLLNTPNKITDADFRGWVQERGLYFASKWDRRYETPFETHDPGEKPMKGETLVARYGKGVYIFTAFSWFRELPAGVPGAYRIFANFLSASKTLSSEGERASQ